MASENVVGENVSAVRVAVRQEMETAVDRLLQAMAERDQAADAAVRRLVQAALGDMVTRYELYRALVDSYHQELIDALGTIAALEAELSRAEHDRVNAEAASRGWREVSRRARRRLAELEKQRDEQHG